MKPFLRQTMTPIFFITTFGTLFALSFACCTPDQWEGYQGSLVGYAGFFHRGAIGQSAWIAYDYTNKRVAVYKTYIAGDYEGKFKILTFFSGGANAGKLYIVDLNKDMCWEKELKSEFSKFCVPEDAKDLGTFYLGLKGGFKAHGYYFGRENRGYHNWLTVEDVDEGVCAPVAEQVTGKVGHYKFLDTVTFADISPGIKNESIFTIPDICEKMGDDFSLLKKLSNEQFLFAQ